MIKEFFFDFYFLYIGLYYMYIVIVMYCCYFCSRGMEIFIYFLVLWCSLYRIGRILFGLINCYGLFFFVKEIMMFIILEE